MKRPTAVFGEMLVDLESSRGKFVSYTMYCLNILFLCLYIVGTFKFSKSYSSIIHTIEITLAFLFLFEFISRVDFADDRKAVVFNIYSIADLASIVPVLLILVFPDLGQLAVVRALQFTRIFRFLRIGLKDNSFFGYNVTGQEVAFIEALTAIGIILFVHSGLILAIEGSVNSNINNFWDAIYYSSISLTTTGFGNVTTKTIFGEILTMIGLLIAITVIPWLALRARNLMGDEDRCSRCGTTGHNKDANYCYKCGEREFFEDSD